MVTIAEFSLRVCNVMYLSAPSGFPHSISHLPSDSRTLRLFWNPPPLEQQNGVIVRYSINIMEVETKELRHFLTRDSSTTFVVPNLHPYYNYNYTVAAFTSAGSGPQSPANHVQMPQDSKHSVFHL